MKRLIGSVLLGVGILIAGASGLCSAGFLVSILYVMLSGGPAALGMLPLIASAAVILAAAVIASALPAARAARVDPSVALRAE